MANQEEVYRAPFAMDVTLGAIVQHEIQQMIYHTAVKRCLLDHGGTKCR